MNDESGRLIKVEEKLDTLAVSISKLSELLEKIAVHEERFSALNKRNEQMHMDLRDLKKDKVNIEKQLIINSEYVSAAKKIQVALIVAVLTVVIKSFFIEWKMQD